MLSSEDIEMLTVPKSQKIDALFDVLHKLEDADEILYEAVFGHMPFSTNDEWQDEADKVFWHSEGMHEINEVSFALRNVRDLAQHAIHILEQTTEAEVAY